MQQRPFKQVDVFTDQAYRGNPLAVVLDGLGLSDDAMQRFAHWTNLSETTFLLPPTPEGAAAGADYRVRIFTTAYEMPFAGHPTLGSCHAWLEHGGVPKNPAMVVQECQVGLVNIRQNGGRAAFAAPPLKRQDATPELVQALGDALGLPATKILASQHLNNGPSHFGLLIDNQDTVLELTPDFALLRAAMALGDMTGVGVAALQGDASVPGLIARSNREARAFAGSAAATSEATTGIEVRFFFDHGKGIGEDPVTGSFNASLAQWLIAEGHAPRSYTASQGTCIGVQGRVHIQQDAVGQVWIGGDAVTCISGLVHL
jgi:PhzF family phenazine biosynthesis protein